jgi:hypothetical protein
MTQDTFVNNLLKTKLAEILVRQLPHLPQW